MENILNEKNKFYNLAKYIADNFSKDPNTKVGCILLNIYNQNIVATGYNSFPKGIIENSSRWSTPEKYNYVIHAEMNMINNYTKNNSNNSNNNENILVVTLFPCNKCAIHLIQFGIKLILTKKPDFNDIKWGNSFKFSYKLLTEANVEIIYI